jgi:hypothetical protein
MSNSKERSTSLLTSIHHKDDVRMTLRNDASLKEWPREVIDLVYHYCGQTIIAIVFSNYDCRDVIYVLKPPIQPSSSSLKNDDMSEWQWHSLVSGGNGAPYDFDTIGSVIYNNKESIMAFQLERDDPFNHEGIAIALARMSSFSLLTHEWTMIRPSWNNTNKRGHDGSSGMTIEWPRGCVTNVASHTRVHMIGRLPFDDSHATHEIWDGKVLIVILPWSLIAFPFAIPTSSVCLPFFMVH